MCKEEIISEQTETERFHESLKVPLIVGVTGHIDLDEESNKVADALKAFWDKLYKLIGENTPVILLTSIARGADHYMVKYCPESVKYCVVLPFDEAEYRKDFKEPEDLRNFEEDLHGAFKIINCDAAPRDYTLASDFVRKHSDVLLTMWDGYENLTETGTVEMGGTYYQIREAFGMDDLLQQEKIHLIVNLSVERSRKGPLYHKEHNENQICSFSGNGCLQVLECVENGETDKKIQVACDFRNWEREQKKTGRESDKISDFSDVLNLLHYHNDKKGEMQSAELRADYYLRFQMGPRLGIEKDRKSWDDWNRLDETIRKTREKSLSIVRDDFYRHEYYDKVATGHQTPHAKQFFWIGLVSFLLGFLGQIWGDLTFHPCEKIHEWIIHGVIGIYLIGWLFTFLYWKAIVEKKDHYSRYLQPRVIAELLRLKMFWQLAGIRDCFTDTILRETANSRFALLLCNWEMASLPLPEDVMNGEGLETIRSCWLQDQINYYKGYLLDPDPAIQEKTSFFSLAWFRKVRSVIRIYDDEAKKMKKNKITILSPSWFKMYFHKYERRELYIKILKDIFFRLAFIFALFLIVVFLSAKLFHFDHKDFLCLESYREFLVGICPFIVAILGWLLEKTNWDSIIRQYRITRGLFQKTLNYVQKGNDSENLELKRKIIKELIQYAHQENAEWNSIRNDSKPEPMI